ARAGGDGWAGGVVGRGGCHLVAGAVCKLAACALLALGADGLPVLVLADAAVDRGPLARKRHDARVYATGAGKTTFLRCLAQSVGARERVVTIEEVFELDLGLRDVVAMQTRQANLEGP